MTDLSKKYQNKTPLELLRDKPAMFIGSIDNDIRPNWVFNKETNRMEYKSDLTYPHGLLHIFLEILMNAVDQSKRVSNLTYIKVSIEDNIIIVENNGDGIDVAINEKMGIYYPEMLFSVFASSSNYNEDETRTVVGTHGIGAKATVVFSKEFKVETVDAKRKLKFSQVYTDNLSNKTEAKIKAFTGKPFTRISFLPDYKRFGLKGMTNDLKAIIEKTTIDTAILTDKKISIYFNNEKIPVRDLNTYISLYIGEDSPRVIEENYNPRFPWAYGIAYSDGFKHISFVNGTPTRTGGTHVNYLMGQISKGLIEVGNSKREMKEAKLKESDIKNNCFLFLIATVKNPEFPNQIKEELGTKINKFGVEVKVSDKFVKAAAKNTDVLKQAMSLAQFKNNKKLNKTDGKKKSTIKMEKLEDAEWAGTAKSAQCSLIIVEGDSAKTSVMAGINELGRKKYGVFPIRGKMLNVRDASVAKVSANQEITKLKTVLGLKQELKDINELRYGRIIILTDADVDGTHIKGLIINLFHHYWRDFLKKSDFIQCWATPILKVEHKKKSELSVSFYSIDEFEKWKEQNKNNLSKYKDPHYYKGLGTSEDTEFIEYCKNPRLIRYNYTNKSDEAIIKAFAKDKANDRKEWLKHYDPKGVIDYGNPELTFEKFIDKELIHFSSYDNHRSIPSVIDGLKPSQRKILYTMFKCYRNVEKIKVAQLGSKVAEETQYHHGEGSLSGAIVVMAQNYVGSNNMNLLYPQGQFGSRLMGGKDNAQPRYIFTRLDKNADILFDKRDENVLEYLEDEGKKIEPLYYVPLLPLILINGADGIGTGYSTNIPCYNPDEVRNNIINLIKGKKMKELVPWYQGFKGTIKKEKTNSFISKGKYEMMSPTKIRITELPIRKWTDDYKEFLENNDLVKKMINKSTKTTVDFTIELVKPIKNIEKELKLTSVINATNMVAFDADMKLKKYKDTNEIIKEFYKTRLEYYDKRKEYIVKQLKREVLINKYKIMFIEYYNEGKIITKDKKKNELIEQLEELDFPELNDSYDYLINMPMYILTKDESDKLKNKKNKLEEELNWIKEQSNTSLYLSDLE